MKPRITELLRKKDRIKERLEEELGRPRARRARRDHHARRRPRHCGMTIHTGIGCGFACIYCYIWDMGFPGKPEAYPLEPMELAYALAVNPYVVPEATMAAYGSVTEPFQPETRERALAYIREVHRWLGLPSQVSTKAVIDRELARSLKASDPGLSLLVTLVALGEKAKRLEPRAPPAEERLEGARTALREGLHVALFLRPIMPGVNEEDLFDILEAAARIGVRDIVLGSLRATTGILARLEAAGFDTGKIRRLLVRKPRSAKDQVPVDTSSIKRELAGYARSLGLRVHPSACSHNMVSHGMPCHACRMGPCYSRPPVPDRDDVIEAINYLGGSVEAVEVNYPYIVLRGLRGVRRDVVVEVLSAASKLMVRVMG